MIRPPWPEQHVHHPHKQADADDHHHDCEQSTRRPCKRDVAEPGRGQRRDREIKRIEIVPNRRVVLMLCFVNDRRHPKKEDEEIGGRDNRIVIAPHEGEIAPHAVRDAIGAKQAERAEHAKKAEIMTADWGQERDDDRYISEAERMDQVV